MDTDEILAARKLLRRQERLARKEHRMNKLEQNLLSILPSALVPGNVGEYDSVAWPFTYTVRFNLGTSPITFDQTFKQTQSFQVTQEAAFICGSISRKCNSGGSGGELAPLQIQIRDRQSTRQFMDFPIPLQAIAKKTPPTIWEVPLIFMPNAFVDIDMTVLPGVNQISGFDSPIISLNFSGYRTRTQDIGEVLSTIFGRG